jgi:hypothetical protein
VRGGVEVKIFVLIGDLLQMLFAAWGMLVLLFILCEWTEKRIRRRPKRRAREIIAWLDAALAEHPEWPKIYAIKAHRKLYDSTLAESKEAVEAVMAQYPGRWEPHP